MYTIHYSGFIFKQVSPTETLSFPANADNVFYQQYLAWVAEGNTPEPYEERFAEEA